VDSAALLIAVRFALYVVLMLLFGLPLISLYAWRGQAPNEGLVALPQATLATLAVIGAGLSAYGFLLIAAQMRDVAIEALDRDVVGALLDSSAMGRAVEVRLAALLLALPAIASLRWPGRGTAPPTRASWDGSISARTSVICLSPASGSAR